MERQQPKAEPKGSGLSELTLRTLSALVMLPACAAIVYFGGPVFDALVVLISIILAYECAAVTGTVGRFRISFYCVAVLIPVAIATIGHYQIGLLAMLGACAVLLLLRGVPSLRIGFVPIAAVIYIDLACISAEWLRFEEGGVSALVLLLIVVVATDIGAYIAGRTLGGPKLWPAVSPKKTWSGAIGGLTAASCGACLFGYYFGASLGPLVLATILLSIASQSGDFLESWAKRRGGVKDSGRLIPGHGGVFDRLDGFVAATPILAIIVVVVGAAPAFW